MEPGGCYHREPGRLVAKAISVSVSVLGGKHCAHVAGEDREGSCVPSLHL